MASNSKAKIKQALNQPHPGHIEPPTTPNTLWLTHKQIQLTQLPHNSIYMTYNASWHINLQHSRPLIEGSLQTTLWVFLAAATLAAMEAMVMMAVEVDFCLSGRWWPNYQRWHKSEQDIHVVSKFQASK
jgi:hypothetical protein